MYTHLQTQLKPSSEPSFIPPSTMLDPPAIQQSQSKQQIIPTDSLNLNNELAGVQFHASGQISTNLSAKDPPTTNDLPYSNQIKIIQNNDDSDHSEANDKATFDSNGQFSDNLIEKPSLLDYLRNHLSPFSGTGDAYRWFIQLDSTFSDLKLSFRDRIEILPYFLGGKAMIWYSLNRQKIIDYLDFCQLFTLEFLNAKPSPDSHSSSQSMNSFSSTPSPVILGKNSIDTPMDQLLNTTTSFIPHHTTSSLDPHPSTSRHSLSSTISKALIDRFVKDPLKFYGGKDNVITWLDEIDQQFQIMNLSDPDKLNLIHICLKGEAHQWFKQHPKNFSSWPHFVSEIKHSFNSNLQRDVAFHKLQRYHQTIHQSAFQYYNEMIKLIQQANPQMHESTKVHYLMNGLRDSLSIETRRNYPTTTQEFLTQVKIAEDLTALNSSFNNHAMIHTDPTSFTSFSRSQPSNLISTNEYFDSSQHANDNIYQHTDNYSNDDVNQPRYLNKISHTPGYSSKPNQHPPPPRSAHTPEPTSYPRPLLDPKHYRHNNSKQQAFQRCFKCGSSDHIARYCSHFDKRDQ
jgi:hypothetical protein